MKIPPRLQRLLEEQDIQEAEDLASLCRREVGDLQGIGPKSLDQIEEAMRQEGISLAEDPWAPYVCARHGQPRGDARLQSFFLCDSCGVLFSRDAFQGKDPEYVGSPVDGYCLHCNQHFEDVRLRQWYVCDVCNRVVRSIGRSIVADATVKEWWETEVGPQFPMLELTYTDPPTLQPRNKDQIEAKVPNVDFTCIDKASEEPVFGIELKTGRSHIKGSSIGSKMGTFQLDNSDCDDILSVVNKDLMPVYLVHAQVIDRATPPTIYYVGVGLWWTDLFSMAEKFQTSRTRPRETRIAAYYNTAMFQEMTTFIDHLTSGGPQQIRERMQTEGVPRLYE